MQIATRSRRIVQGLVLAVALGAGGAMAQSEPTLNQVYATAQAGQLDQAQLMIQQVLIGHPNSAKAHFVRAELYARQGDTAHARESLATAERLSPGLSFAKPEAVQALRTQLAARSAASTSSGFSNTHPVAVNAAPVQQPSNASGSWAMPVLLLGVVMVAGYFIFRRRAPQPEVYPAQYGPSGSGLSGPQTFGMGGGGGAAAPYPAGGYAQPAGTGLGGRIMGGVATGLAVGAGVMAAEAIGRSVFGNHNTAQAGTLDQGNYNDYQPIADTNRDMGGNDFGINDAGSWDDGGGDWDN